METDIYKTEPHRNIPGGTIENRSSEGTLDQTKKAVSEAYTKTAETLSDTYDQAMSYVRDNPGKTTLIALGIGVGLGLLLASGGRRSRMRRIGEPIVNALSDIALEIVRGL